MAIVAPTAAAHGAGVGRSGTVNRVGNRGIPIQIAPLQAAPAKALPSVDDVLVQVNAARSRAGLPAFKWNSKVANAAQVHADYLASIRQVVHAGPNGARVGQRLASAGFSFTSYGEALGAGYPTTNALVQAWLSSPTHRVIILGNFQYVGVGVAVDNGGTAYWSLVVANGS